MKKFFHLTVFLLFCGLAVLGCRSDDAVDNDTYSRVIEVRESFVKSSSSNSLYGIHKTFSTPLFSSDVVLVYRQDGTSGGTPIWKLLPKTYYLSQGELDYTFDFTKNDVQIFANGNFNLAAQDAAFQNAYLNNQTFRVVVVPASFASALKSREYTQVILQLQNEDIQVRKF